MKNNKIIVIKIGGSIIDNNIYIKNIIGNVRELFLKNFKIIIVHGGSKQIDREMIRHKIKIKKIDGKRYTDLKTIKILDKCCKQINDRIVNLMKKHKINVTGLHSKYNTLMYANKLQNVGNLGYVGYISRIKKLEFLKLLKDNIVVISPLIPDERKKLYNVNADDVAQAISTFLKVDRLIFISDIDGVKYKNRIIKKLKVSNLKQIFKKDIVSGGMIAKLNACIKAIKKGVRNIHIVNGKYCDIILKIIFNKYKPGTTIQL